MSARKTPAQHTVRVEHDDFHRDWGWCRYSANNVKVATSPRWWEPSRRRHCIDAAKSEARLTGARLVIDGEEVTV